VTRAGSGGIAVIDVGDDVLLAKDTVPVPIDQSSLPVQRWLQVVVVRGGREEGDLVREERHVLREMPLVEHDGREAAI
jgi:hypothetical protein